MAIDLITLILIVLAVWKGYRRGFIVAICSFLGILIGLAAAVKLSVLLAGWLQDNTNIGDRWLPFISFAGVMILVIIIVNLVARLVQASVEMVSLGWLNRLVGIVFYLALYFLVYSIVLFYITRMGILREATISGSSTYNLIEPFGPMAMGLVGDIIPVFRNMFDQLQHFFGGFTPAHAV